MNTRLRLFVPVLALAMVAAACGGSSVPIPTTTTAAPTTTTAAPTTTAPTTTAAPTTTLPAICAANEEQVATALAAMDTTPATPTEFADTMRAANAYLTWLAGELPDDLVINAQALEYVTAQTADAFDGKDDFVDGLEEFYTLVMNFETQFGFEEPGEAEYAIDDFLLVCGTVDNQVFKAIEETFSIFDEMFEEDDDMAGDGDGDDPFGDDFSAPEYEGELPDAPAGFCAGLQAQVYDIVADLMPAMGDMDEDPSPDQLVELLTSMDPLYAWMVDNVPSELTADAELVRSVFTDLTAAFADIDPETATEEAVMSVLFTAMLALGDDLDALDLAGLRIDTFVSRECGVSTGEGPLGLIEGFVDDEGMDEPPTVTTVDTLSDALRVPDDFATIQEAVDASMPGDLVLIGPGTYHEAVVVETDGLVIRGTDRNAVIIDGEHERENGFIVFSNGVAIENLTTHSHTSNGVFFTGDYGTDFILDGYRASYVTAYNNGLYGIYAFNATNGLIENSYGSGHPDSAFYIGQCNPCDAVVRNVIAENNALGYSGTNASGNLIIHDSEWRNNRIGMVPNTLDSEELAPQGDIVIVGNYVHDNGNEDTPRKSSDWDAAFGVGIVVAGGNDNLITRNLVEDNSFAGIASAVFIDENLWHAERNTVTDNVVSGSPYDLFLMVWESTAGPMGNCFAGNTFETSIPADIETVAPCDGEASGFEDNGAPNFGEYTKADHTTMPVPPDQPTMPDALSAPPDAPVAPPAVDLDSIGVPTPGA
ncbi:MAG: right-handed parallel beta-helix repeat-containing protein [Actinobacteria bacterium]|nr:right-handed parallel beta-helix repeat-containing protein [Actinomycetota bacterium]